MRPGATRIESNGSLWWIDDEAMEYLRCPKVEGPRPPGPGGQDWGGPGAGPLEDLKWHPMQWWAVDENYLRIGHDDTRCITAPRWAVA